MVNIDCRDRTMEFKNTIMTMQSRIKPAAAHSRQGSDVSRNIAHRNEFMRAAKDIGRELANTCVKLEKLASLAKKRSLFNDKSTEIQDLTYYVKLDINSLNKRISELQQLVKSHQSQSSKNMQKHSSNVVITLQSKLAYMSHEFQQVLEVRTENLKQQSLRKEQFGKETSVPLMSFASATGTSGPGKSILMEEFQTNRRDDTVIDMGSGGQIQQRMRLINDQDEYLSERASAMENIEKTIVDLGKIFQQLGSMIKEQDELITRIDHNVDETDLNITAAHGELLKYFQSISSNRWLIIKIFFVLIIFFILFVLFAA